MYYYCGSKGLFAKYILICIYDYSVCVAIGGAIYIKKTILYLIVQILCSFANNVFSSRKAVQRYPFINNKEKLSSIEKQEISKEY